MCYIFDKQFILICVFFLIINWNSVLILQDHTSNCKEYQLCFAHCTETTPVDNLTRYNWQINVTWHTIKALYKTKCCFDMKTTRPSRSAHLIKPQTLRGLINVPAKFHKWRINYNWFHSLIHLLKWHPFIHVLTCFAPACSRWENELTTSYFIQSITFRFSLQWNKCYTAKADSIHTQSNTSFLTLVSQGDVSIICQLHDMYFCVCNRQTRNGISLKSRIN